MTAGADRGVEEIAASDQLAARLAEDLAVYDLYEKGLAERLAAYVLDGSNAAALPIITAIGERVYRTILAAEAAPALSLRDPDWLCSATSQVAAACWAIRDSRYRVRLKGEIAMKLEVRRIGNLTGIILPNDVLVELGLAEGQAVYVTRLPEGGMRLSRSDPDVERTMQVVDDVMNEYEETMRTLAR